MLTDLKIGHYMHAATFLALRLAAALLVAWPLVPLAHDAVPEVATKFETETESDQELTN